MKSFRALAAVLLVISCLVGVVIFLLTSSWLLEKFFIYKIERDHPYIDVASLKIDDHVLGRDASFHIKDLTGVLFVNGQKFDVAIDGIDVADLRALFVEGRDSRFLISGIQIIHKSVKVKEAKADLKFKGADEHWLLSGDVAIASIEAAGQQFTDATFGLEANEKELSFKGMHLNLAEGVVKGDLLVSMEESFPYNLKLELNRVPAKYIATENFNLEDQLRGAINGRFQVSGDTRRIGHIDAQLDAPNGMYMNARFLGLLLNYIPQSTQKQQIEKLIKEGKNIYIDQFKLDIMNDNSESMRTAFDLKSIDYNLDVKLGVDINVEGGMMALFKQGLSFIPKEGQ